MIKYKAEYEAAKRWIREEVGCVREDLAIGKQTSRFKTSTARICALCRRSFPEIIDFEGIDFEGRVCPCWALGRINVKMRGKKLLSEYERSLKI